MSIFLSPKLQYFDRWRHNWVSQNRESFCMITPFKSLIQVQKVFRLGWSVAKLQWTVFRIWKHLLCWSEIKLSMYQAKNVLFTTIALIHNPLLVSPTIKCQCLLLSSSSPFKEICANHLAKSAFECASKSHCRILQTPCPGGLRIGFAYSYFKRTSWKIDVYYCMTSSFSPADFWCIMSW